MSISPPVYPLQLEGEKASQLSRWLWLVKWLMLIPHAITTFGPLIILPKLTWKGFLVPNLIGQYIIKNLVIISLAIFIATFEAETNEMEKSLVDADGDLIPAGEDPRV